MSVRCGATQVVRFLNRDREFRLATISVVSESAEEPAESLWELVAMIQRATLELTHEVNTASLDLTSRLDASVVFQKLARSTNVSFDTVALHSGLQSHQAAERLQQMLQAFEEEIPAWIRTTRRHESAFESLKDAIHDYLRISLDFTNKQRDVEQRVERAMYDFAYGLSHEINNPLANIAARASDLATTASSERERKSLRTIVDQTMKAHEMLAEMMLAVKMPVLNMAPGDLRTLALAISREWQNRAVERNITWNCQVTDDFLWSVFDRIAMSEAVSAGIRNAIEACRSGDTLTFIAERAESSAGELEVRLAIIDNGPGVPSAALERAWDLYYSGREAGRGLGIGLAKVRRIVESHHGRVWLESRAQQGCGMEIRLPWKRKPSVA